MSVDFEPILLAQYTDTEGIRTLLGHGLKDENVEDLGDHALKVWKFSKEYYQRHGSAPVEQVILEEFEDYVRTVREKGDPDLKDVDLLWVVDTLQRNYLHKKMLSLMAEHKINWNHTKDEALENARDWGAQLLKATMDSSTDEPLRSVQELLPSYLDDLFQYRMRLESGEIPPPVTFGFKDVDAQYMGIAAGELALMFAYTGMGKSFLMCKVALAAVLQGKTVAMWTLENSRDETMDRLAALAGRLNYDHIKKRVLAPVERNKLNDLIGNDAMSRLFIKHPRSYDGASLEEMYYESKNLGADVLLGDQLSHVNFTGKKNDGDWLVETLKLKHARNLGDTLGIASIWAAQANAKAQGKAQINLGMIARSQGYLQGSDFVFGLSGDKNTQVRRYECLKARRGPELAWQMAFNYTPMDIETGGLAP